MSDDHIKEDLHTIKFKNRGKTDNRNHSRHLGNCTSLASSRPSSTLCSQRVNQKAINQKIETHHIIDYAINADKKNYQIEPVTHLDLHHPNHYNQANSSTIENKIKSDIVKIVHLPKIDERIYLGNVTSAIDAVSLNNYRISVIINLSDYQLADPVIKIHDIKYKDTKLLSYSQFVHILSTFLSIIDQVPIDQNILVICTKGVNRSASMIIGYAINRKHQTFNEALNYIETQKSASYSFWDTLTNQKMKNLLRADETIHNQKT